ncbi:MAG TPA: hypothetical protein VEU47_06675 [Candidatus Cybelea sp.]|nr:hypothetical protein [Candidatus Cybelea sp.]
MNRQSAKCVTVLFALSAMCMIAFTAATVWAQDKQKYAFKPPPGSAKYTQQTMIDVGDVPGHQVRLLELHSVFPGDAPVFDGVKEKEGWLRAFSDYTDANGHIFGYTVAIMENGDKIFGRIEGVTQTTVGADGSKTTRTVSTNTLTGGTGKFKGIRGTLRGIAATDFKNLSENGTEGEYWIEK